MISGNEDTSRYFFKKNEELWFIFKFTLFISHPTNSVDDHRCRIHVLDIHPETRSKRASPHQTMHTPTISFLVLVSTCLPAAHPQLANRPKADILISVSPDNACASSKQKLFIRPRYDKIYQHFRFKAQSFYVDRDLRGDEALGFGSNQIFFSATGATAGKAGCHVLPGNAEYFVLQTSA